MKYIVANWKANKDLEQVREWLETFSKNYRQKGDTIVIIAPSFPFLQEVVSFSKETKNIYAAAQDLSQFEEGSFTGEVTAKSLRGLVDYVILGHSERRKNFNESNEIIAQKVELAYKYQIKTILCLDNKVDKLTREVEIVAYEPLEAIGTGNNESIENVLEFKKSLQLGNSKFLYGGSVNDQNIKDYLSSDQIDGLLVGGASLDAEQFSRIISAV